MKILFLICLLSIISFAEELKVNATNVDKVTIFVRNNNNKDIEIGKTPFKMDIRKLIKRYTKSNIFFVTLKKDGYEDYRVLYSHTGTNNVKINARLTVDKDQKLVQDLDGVMSELFEAQRLIRGKSYGQAIKKLSSVSTKYPFFSVPYELKASTYYLMKNYKESLSFYRKAFSMNPKNRDAYIMKNYLEKKFNIKSI